MKNEFIMAINQVCSERQLSKHIVLEAVEAALISAYKRNFGSAQNIVAKLNPESGQAHVFVEKEIVDEITDPKSQILLAEALEIDEDAQVGETILIESTPKDFGRIAAQTAKQVILQRIREAEREALYSSYAEREGEIVTGTVQNVTTQAVTLNLGKAEALLPRNEQIPSERYHTNQRLRAYVLEVHKTNRGPQIIVSRTHRNMLRRLLELEVPEIFNGTVEIKTIAREPGSRSKVAVAATQEGVDPVGSCVGMRGVRIQSIVNELGGEKIDIVEWNADTATFIANALSPAKVMSVFLENNPDSGKTATVVVPDRQLSLAIGKEGQNARLAAKLTGWRIDIKNASEIAEEALRAAEREAQAEAEAEEEDILAKAEAILREKALADEAAAEEVPAEVVPATAEVEEEAEALAVEEIEAETIEELLPEALAEEAEIIPFEEEAELEEVGLEEEPLEIGEEVELEIEEVFEEVEPVEFLDEDEIEDEDDEEEKRRKKKKRRRKRTLIFDEDLGTVVSKRRRKPSRRTGWEEEAEEDYF